MVLQETWLKSGTVRDNIKMGRPSATDEEMYAAAKASHADGFIRRLSEGYDTVLSEEGGSLSQGQKQLLCIARIMLCLPPMLILDEATSSIDTRTEMKISDAFNKLTEGRDFLRRSAPPFHHPHRGYHSRDERGTDRGAGHPRGTFGKTRVLLQTLQQSIQLIYGPAKKKSLWSADTTPERERREPELFRRQSRDAGILSPI